MANPVLNENIFRNQPYTFNQSGVMTIGGTATKTLLLLLMVIAGAAYTWKLYYNAINPQSITGWMFGGLIVAFIMAMIISFISPFVAFLDSIPGCVMGGVCITLYGFIAVSGLKMIQKVDLEQNANLFTASAILIPGIGGMAMAIGKVTVTAIACSLILGIIVNLILNKARK